MVSVVFGLGDGIGDVCVIICIIVFIFFVLCLIFISYDMRGVKLYIGVLLNGMIWLFCILIDCEIVIFL